MNRALLIMGAGGHGKVVADCAEAVGWKEIFFLDDKQINPVLGYPILGSFSEAEKCYNPGISTVVALGDHEYRMRWILRLLDIGYDVETILHPKAWISPHASIDAGCVAFAGAVVNAGARIGLGCILNTGCSVDHDCVLEDGVHISPGAHLGGNVTVGAGSWVCVGASVGHGVTIGKACVIAAGAAVVEDVPDGALAGGVPSIIKRRGKQDE